MEQVGSLGLMALSETDDEGLRESADAPSGHNETAGRGGLIEAYRHSRSDQLLRRDSDVMGLTVCVALLVALTAGNDFTPHSKTEVLAVVWGTTVGLALTHWFAMVAASRLVSSREMPVHPLASLISQTLMAVTVAAFATAAVMLLSARYDRLGARIVAALFMAGLVLFETRRSGLSTVRTITLSLGTAAAGISVALAKWFIS